MSRRPLRFCLFYDFRNPLAWRQDPSALYRTTLDQIVRGEQLGWDDVWVSEHHFVEDDYLPSTLTMLAAIAARTSRVRIGTGILLLPLHDPVRVAEDAAVVDVLSGGRLELGFGAGYRVEELAAWRVAPEERGSRMNEAIPLIRRLFAGETLTHTGKHYQYGELSLRPRPVQPKVPIWIAGLTSPAVKRAARLADGFYGIGPIRPFVDEFKREVEQRGGDPETREIASALMYLQVTREPERKWREAVPHMAYQVNLYAQWAAAAGQPSFSPSATRADLEANGCFIATPERACEIVERFVEENALTRLFSWTIPPGLPPEWSDEHVELMAREVIPNFRSSLPSLPETPASQSVASRRGGNV